MLNLTTRAKQLTQFALTLSLGATLFVAGTAAATGTYKCEEYKQVYAQTDYASYPHQHLDVVCQEGYRAISCEAAIAGQNDYDYSQHFIALNEAHPADFNKNSHGQYEHTSGHASYSGCHFRANNFLATFTPAYHAQYAYDFAWRLKGFATCVPQECVSVEPTHAYYPEYDEPVDF
jgi:hypothetical protein